MFRTFLSMYAHLVAKRWPSKLYAEGDIVHGEVMVTPSQLLLLSIMQFDKTRYLLYCAKCLKQFIPISL